LGISFLPHETEKSYWNMKFNQKNSSMLCIGVNKIKIHFDTSQLCCGVVHLGRFLKKIRQNLQLDNNKIWGNR